MLGNGQEQISESKQKKTAMHFSFTSATVQLCVCVWNMPLKRNHEIMNIK